MTPKPERPPWDPSNHDTRGWTPWTAPSFLAVCELPFVLVLGHWRPWTLAATVPVCLFSVLLFWRHQRALASPT